ncbi:MAG TPA: hypothetical protein VL523_01455 [Terriglobia bacterium]|nr:hypothetical protein [Terriglobia bacterium]
MSERSKTLEVLRRQRDELYQDAQANPGSDSGEIVRLLLLEGLSHLQPDPFGGAPRGVLGAERQRGQLVRSVPLEGPEAAGESETGKAAAGTLRHGSSDLERKYHDVRARLDRVGELADTARQAAANGQLDAAAVYEQIAQIIGLRAPTQNDAEARFVNFPQKQG